MSDLLQPGKYSPGPHAGREGFRRRHPDADQLNAFVEHTLPEHERLETLAHLADCAQCRQIVALAVPPLEGAAEADSVSVVLPRFADSVLAWFSSWKVAWIVAAVLAGLVVLTVHFGHLPAKRPRAGQIGESRPPAPPAPTPLHPGSETSQTTAKPQTATGVPVVNAEKPKLSVEAHKSEDLDLSGRARVIAARPLSPATRGNSLPSKAAPAKASQAEGGPVVSRSKAAGIAAHADTAVAPPSKQSANALGLDRTPVQSAPQFPHKTVPAAPPAGSQSSAPEPLESQVPDQSYIATPTPSKPTESAAIARKAQDTQILVSSMWREAPRGGSSNVPDNAVVGVTQVSLPSGRPVLSLAANRHRRLALDERDQLFLSGDDGQHWRAVSVTWRGRAIAVASIPVASIHALAPALALAVPERYTPGATAAEEMQVGSESGLRGVVTDANGAAVPGATVVATDNKTALMRTAETDPSGRYLVEELPPGVYRVEVQAAGFARQSQVAVVNSPQQAAANFALSIGQSSQAVPVEASSEQDQNTSRNKSSAVAKAGRRTSALPLNDLPPVFVLTTETGDRWTSTDGQTWKPE